MRRALAAAVAGATVLLTSACTVPGRAVAGIGVDADGNPVGYIQVCHEHIDGATMYVTEDDRLGTWQSSTSVTGFTSWSLSNPTAPWTAVDPLVPLKPGVTYRVYGWTNDNSSSAEGVDFTVSDLAAMKPGQVRYWRGQNDGVKDTMVVTSEDEFRKTACRIIGNA